MKKLGFLVAIMLASSAFMATEVMASDWTGPYAGLQAGYIWGDADTYGWQKGEGYGFDIKGFQVDGWVGGIYGGYMWQFGNDMLIGLEGEWNWPSADDKITIHEVWEGGSGDWGATIEQKWDASLRLNAGKQMGDYMLYVTGGFAWSETAVYGFKTWEGGQKDSNSAKLAGWTIGAGAEKKINENIHARIQYRYSDYGSKTWVVQTDDINRGKVEHTNHMLTVGVSYCF